MAEVEEEAVRLFRCPKCFQTYELPPATVPLIVEHMGKHRVNVTYDFVLSYLRWKED